MILTCYHSWKDLGIFERENKKRKSSGASDAYIVHIKNKELETLCTEALTRDMFICFSVEKDYAVIKFDSSQMASVPQRIPISYTIAVTMPIHAFGFPGYKNGQAMVINGEITLIKQNRFQLSLLSAPGLSGSAIIADDSGRAVGYLGGAIDASNNNNSQQQSYAFKFDEVAACTNRDESPATSPDKGIKHAKGSAESNSSSSSSFSSNAQVPRVPVQSNRRNSRSKGPNSGKYYITEIHQV